MSATVSYNIDRISHRFDSLSDPSPRVTAYLTFVAINGRNSEAPGKEPTLWLSRFWRYLAADGANSKQKNAVKKPVLASVQTSTRLEARRHLLAGRRRAKRIGDARKGEARDGVSIEVKKQLQKEVLEMLKRSDEIDREVGTKGEVQLARQQKRIQSVEIEFMIRALMMQEEGIVIKDGKVEVHIPGDEPFSHPEAEVRRIAGILGLNLPGDKSFQLGRRLSADFFAPLWKANASPAMDRMSSLSYSDRLDVASTLATTMHLVFPQHTNSHSIIFGGNTMSWSEDVAMLSCRNILVTATGSNRKRRSNWKTVAMDGLEFNVRVAMGE
jgi:hypothetical protein